MAEPRRAHTESDIDIRGVAWFGVALILTVAAVGVATHVTLSILDRRPASGTANRSPLARNRMPPEPRLQTSPPADMAAFRAHENAILNSSGWVDPSAGIARIPIDVAKRRLLEKGLPVAASAPAPPRGEKP
jgi:hypothetical protein